MPLPSGPSAPGGAAPLTTRTAAGAASLVKRRACALSQFLQHLVNTVILGGTYALLGIGLTLIFGIMRVVNFTHGELYAFGAYAVFAIAMVFGGNFFLALALAVIGGMVLGAIIEMILLRPMRGADI